VYNASVNKMIGAAEPFSRKLCLDKLDDSLVEWNHRNGKILFHCRVRFDFIDTHRVDIEGKMRGGEVYNTINQPLSMYLHKTRTSSKYFYNTVTSQLIA